MIGIWAREHVAAMIFMLCNRKYIYPDTRLAWRRCAIIHLWNLADDE